MQIDIFKNVLLVNSISSQMLNECDASTWTQGIDNSNDIDLNCWYRIGSPESHTGGKFIAGLYLIVLFIDNWQSVHSFEVDIWEPLFLF